MEERGHYAKLIHNLRGLQFKVTACLGARDWVPSLMISSLGDVLALASRRNFILSLGS